MTKFLWLLYCSFVVTHLSGQEITRQHADSVLAALRNTKPALQRIDLLLNLAQFHIFKPGERQIDFDSAIVYMNEANALIKTENSPAASGYSLLTQSYLLKEKGEKEKSKKLVEEAIPLLASGTNKSYLGNAYFELSGYYQFWIAEELTQRILLVQKALAAYQEAKDLKNIARSYEMLGDLYVRQEAHSEAIEALNHALDTYKAMHYPQVQGVYVLLGETYMYKNEYGRALANIQKALKTSLEVNDTSMRLCQINNMMGSLYWNINNKKESLKYKEDALKTAIKYGDAPAIFTMAITISVNQNGLGRTDEALKVLSLIPKSYLANIDTTRLALLRMAYLRTYLAAEQLDKAQSMADSTLPLLKYNGLDYQIRLAINRLVAGVHFNKKEYRLARNYLTRNLGIQEKVNHTNGRIEDARIWYKLDSAQGDFKAAFKHFTFLKEKTDSLLSETTVRQLQVLGVEYETQLKEDSIKLKDQDIALLQQENSLQQANLREASLIRNVTMGGIIVALLIAVLMYRQSSHRQKVNQLMAHKNKQLESLVNEKEWLVKEIHHRVKNNLQIIMSLLNSQSAYIDNEFALTAIHDSQHRVYAMSLIHQKLYGSENVSSIDMSVYVRDVVSYLSESFDTRQRIRFLFDIEPISMDVSQAVPIGLILNEAITNAIKYAFPDGRTGSVSLVLRSIDEGGYLLGVSDDGVGMPTELRNKKGSLGMSLMRGLSEDLNGSLSIENDHGVKIILSFREVQRVKQGYALVESLLPIQ